MKNTVSIAIAGGDAFSDIVASLPARLAEEATTGTNHFGEVMVVVEDGGKRLADQRVSTPHLWEGTLFYLTAIAAEDPAALLAYDTVLPPSRVLYAPAQAGEQTDGGCDCATGERSAPDTWSAWVGLSLILGAAALRKRRSRGAAG